MNAKLFVLLLGVLMPTLVFCAPIVVDPFNASQDVSVGASRGNPVAVVDTVAAENALGISAPLK